MNRLDMMRIWMLAEGSLHHLRKPKLDASLKTDVISRLCTIQEHIEEWIGQITVMDCHLAFEAAARSEAERRRVEAESAAPASPASQPHGPQGDQNA